MLYESRGAMCSSLIPETLLSLVKHRLVLDHLDARSTEQLGAPVRVGQWYNSTVGIRASGRVLITLQHFYALKHASCACLDLRDLAVLRSQVADCTLNIFGADRQGSIAITLCRDVSASKSVFMYHMFDSGMWRVEAASVLIPDRPSSH